MTTKIALNYQEREALRVMQKMIKRKPEALGLLMEGMSREAAVNVLLTAKKEMQDLHTMAQALVAAAAIIVKMDQPTKGE